jgi:hypothetical protein
MCPRGAGLTERTSAAALTVTTSFPSEATGSLKSPYTGGFPAAVIIAAFILRRGAAFWPDGENLL